VSAGLRPMIEAALAEVVDALAAGRDGLPTPFPGPALEQIADDLRGMLEAMSPAAYSPGYPRYLIDRPESGDLGDRLLEIAYRYDQLR
jgi:hypothetical protein